MNQPKTTERQTQPTKKLAFMDSDEDESDDDFSFKRPGTVTAKPQPVPEKKPVQAAEKKKLWDSDDEEDY